MRRSLSCVVLIPMLALCGCAHKCYELEITPDGDGFQRKLTCWQEGGATDEESDSSDSSASPLDDEELARIEKHYGKRQSPADAGKTVFQGRFTDAIPADVGGAGTYLHYASPLGEAYSYVERFRGSDDVQASLERRRAAVDKLIDVLLGWLESELGKEPNFPQLRKFVDEDVRRDAVNLGLLLWTAEAMGLEDDEETEAELVARTGQYLREHGYLSPKDVPAIARAILTADETPLFRHLQRLAARKLGTPDGQPIPKSLDFLSDLKRLEASWERYVRTTEAFRRAEKEWEKEKAQNPDAEPPTPNTVMNDVLDDALTELLDFNPADSLKVKLHCGQEPHDTNGDWDEETGTVNWSENLVDNPSLPVICYALWSDPDREFQQSHFGKVVLVDEGLTEYVFWYRGLDADETKQWDRFIAGCKPGDKLAEGIRTFRFSDDPQPDPDNPDQLPPSLADTPRRLLHDALGPAEDPEAEPQDETRE